MNTLRTNGVINVDDTWIYQLDRSLEDNNAWVKRLKKRMAEIRRQSHPCTIYRVPCGLRTIDPIAYEPRILSLGPYHHGQPHLKAMDELKWHYLERFLHRKPERKIEDCLKLVREMEVKTREAYSEAPQMDSKDWVEMMLIDSCFAVEFLLMMKIGPEESDGKPADPIQSTAWMASHVLCDMLLLENQLPFFLLEELVELNSLSNKDIHSVAEIALSVFMHLMPGKIRKSSSLDSIGNIHHILHLLYSSTLPGNPATDEEIGCDSRISILDERSPLQWMPSAKNLKDAGVAFKKKKNMTSFMEITFQRGTLEIPPLQIFGQSNPVFRNLIAFEQSHMGNPCPTYWGSYACLMDCIIDTPADVALLQQHGIIVSTLGNNDDIARFFNQLRTNTAYNVNSYLSGVFADVERHCDKRTNRLKASLNRTYFTNPWASVSFTAAIILFLLTITQTVLAFFSYLSPRSP